MKTFLKSALYLFMTVAVFGLMTACGGSGEIVETVPDAVCSAIVNEKCVRCHYKTRICDALDTKSVRDWKKSINFMLKQGAQLSQDEQNKLIGCLSGLPRGSNVVCQ